VGPGRGTGPYGAAFLLWRDHTSPGDLRSAAAVAGAGLSLAKFSKDPLPTI